MALATFALNWAGCLARAFTVFVESDNLAFWFQQFVAICLTTTIMIQLYIYRDNTLKQLQYQVATQGDEVPDMKLV